MPKDSVRVIIDKKGDVSIQVCGVKGTSCLDLTQDLVKALGSDIKEWDFTKEAHESPVESFIPVKEAS